MIIKLSTKLLLLPAITFVFLLGFVFVSPEAEAVSRADCNQARPRSDAGQCRNEYDDCENIRGNNAQNLRQRCREGVIQQYTGSAGVGGGAAVGGNRPGVGPAIPLTSNDRSGENWCGNMREDDGSYNEDANFQTKFNFGCLGERAPKGLGPIQDLVFALVRFASIGIGIVITIALIASGIQYSMAQGNPEASQKAKTRAREALIGFAVYIFAFSILQFLIPGGLFV